jgi:tetratricopeptide (TPR) repeat protein
MRTSTTAIVAAALIGFLGCAAHGNSRAWPAAEADIDAGLRQAQLALEQLVARHPFPWQGSAPYGPSPSKHYPAKIAPIYGHLGELYLLEARDFARGYLLVGQSHAFQGDYGKARASFETGLSRAPSADLAYGVGWCLLREAGPQSVSQRSPEQIRQAIALFEQALKLDPNHLLSLNSLAYCHYWLAARTRPLKVDGWQGDPAAWPGHVEAALSAWDRYLKQGRATSMIYYLMGELEHTRGDFPQTARYWELAFQMGGAHPYAHQFMQLYESDLKNPQAAERILCLYVKREREAGRDTGSARELAYFWLRRGRYEDGIRYFRDRAERKPCAWTFFQLGQALEGSNRLAEALTWYRRAKERNPPFSKSLDEAIERVSSRPPAPRPGSSNLE